MTCQAQPDYSGTFRGGIPLELLRRFADATGDTQILLFRTEAQSIETSKQAYAGRLGTDDYPERCAPKFLGRQLRGAQQGRDRVDHLPRICEIVSILEDCRCRRVNHFVCHHLPEYSLDQSLRITLKRFF